MDNGGVFGARRTVGVVLPPGAPAQPSPQRMQPDATASLYDELMDRARQWQQGFDKPMRLGVSKKLTIITCMDSRLAPMSTFGLGIGDAEIIRNAGGRVTADVLRSLVVCIDLLDCDTLIVMHHTDCGGQAVARRFHEVMHKLHRHFMEGNLINRLIGSVVWHASALLPAALRKYLVGLVVHPIYDLDQSVVDDVMALRKCVTVPETVKIYGLVYDVQTGAVREVIHDRETRTASQINGSHYSNKLH